MCETNHSYCVLLNIPSKYRSKHLRNFFNELIESKSFNCFHYRHRPQNVKTFDDNNEDNGKQKDNSKQNKRFCCVIDIKTEKFDEFLDKFNNKFWVDFESGVDLNFKCFIKKIKIIDQKFDSKQKINDKTMDLFRKTIELNSSIAKHKNRELINRLKEKTIENEIHLNEKSDELLLTLTEVKSLRELNPQRDIMPNGNVGTPSEVFLQLIRECRLPPPVISKLELDFPKSMRRRIYSKVEYKYENNYRKSSKFWSNKREDNKKLFNDSVVKDLDLVKTKNGLIINDNFSDFKRDVKKNDDKCMEQTDGSDSDENEVEEWDRHQELHDDVTEQERTKQRLFEEEIELKWEKGGSGLVFYTDAQFWDLKDNCGDFDEKTADDWDLDLNAYRKNCSADKDAIDLKTLTQEMKLRVGKRKYNKYSVDSVLNNKKRDNPKIGYFEEHTKGFGRKIMESQGWKSGKGLGSSVSGIPEPIEDCGQLPSDKRGFGFRGEKLNSFQFLKPKANVKQIYSK